MREKIVCMSDPDIGYFQLFLHMLSPTMRKTAELASGYSMENIIIHLSNFANCGIDTNISHFNFWEV